MDDVAGWKVTGGYIEHAVDLLQLVAATGEKGGEEEVGQIADRCRGLFNCVY